MLNVSAMFSLHSTVAEAGKLGQADSVRPAARCCSASFASTNLVMSSAASTRPQTSNFHHIMGSSSKNCPAPPPIQSSLRPHSLQHPQINLFPLQWPTGMCVPMPCHGLTATLGMHPHLHNTWAWAGIKGMTWCHSIPSQICPSSNAPFFSVHHPLSQ